MIKIFSVITAICLIGSIMGINLFANPVDGQIIPSAGGFGSSITKVTVAAIMDLFMPIILGIINITRKMIAITFSLFSFTEPLIKSIRSIIGLTIYEYFGEFGYLIYYGFIRPVLLDIVLAGISAVLILLNVIGLIPIVSIPCALIYDYLALAVLLPLVVSMISYFPQNSINPITQGINTIKIGFAGGFGGVIWVVLAILLIIYTFFMIIPIINIAPAIVAGVACAILGIILIILLPVIVWILNLPYILPTLLNYTPIVNSLKRIPSDTINLITDVIYKTIDLISVFNI